MEYVFLDEMKSTNEIIQNMQIIIIKTHFAFHIYHTILSFLIKQNFIWHFNLQRYYLATSELWPKFLIACCHFPERDLDFQQSHKNQSVCNDKCNIYFLENWKWKIPMIRFSPLSKPPPTSYRSTLKRVWYDNFLFSSWSTYRPNSPTT